MMAKFYITTPLYYVNARPHIGHSYTEVAADAVARFHRLMGDEVFFLTGTDEHGQKIAQAAEKNGQTPQAFADAVVAEFVGLWKTLSVSYDDFIRTTEPRHKLAVQKVLQVLFEKGDLYEGSYEGFYCTPCETFWTPTQLGEERLCPDCKRALESITETNYFFRLSKYQPWLLAHWKEHEEGILPASRRNEILSLLTTPLPDLCVTRPRARLSWGVEVPFSSNHVTYVWFDALLNYVSAAGYGSDPERLARLWPADLQLVGKDILRHHAVTWPIMLKALDLAPPRRIFAHGWWTLDGEKISKSKGRVIEPIDLIERFGVDGYRYFLLREVPFGLDGAYSEQAFTTRFNSDLANDLGNLLNRSLTMVEKYFQGVVPKPGPAEKLDGPLLSLARETPDKARAAVEELDLSGALAAIWALVNAANKYIEEAAPWTEAKAGRMDRIQTIVYNLVEILRLTAVLVFPFIPETGRRMWRQLGLAGSPEEARWEATAWGGIVPGGRVQKEAPMFPRILK